MREAPLTAEEVLGLWFEMKDRGEEPDLADLCRGDHELKQRVEHLLGYDSLVDRNLPEAPPAPDGPDIPGHEPIALLGRGAMGQVWLAREIGLGRLVALKVFGRAALEGAEGVRIRREAEVAASLEHPNIVPVFGFGETDENRWISMRWLEGPAFDDLPARLSPAGAAEHGMAIAQALHAAHEAGVVHRDVKPANILMDRGRAYLVDFGLSRSVAHSRLTEDNVLAGTLLYMAPERLTRSGSVLDPRSDVYSLGATLYQVVSGSPPHPLDEPSALIRAIIEETPRSLQLRGRDRDFEAIVMRALEKDPERRFNTAQELAEDLRRFVQGEPVLSRRIGWFGRLSRRVVRYPRTVTTIATMAVASAVLGSLLWASRAAENQRVSDQLADARTAIAAGRISEAGSLLSSLDPDREDVQEARESLEGREAFEDLLDAAFVRIEDQSPTRLRQLIARVESTEGSGRPGRATNLATALAWAVLGEGNQARQCLAAADAGRDSGPATRVITALIEKRSDAELPGDPPQDPLECGLVSQGLRLLNVSEEIRRPFAEAVAKHKDDPRAQFIAAIELMSRGELEMGRVKLEDLALAGMESAGRDGALAWISFRQGRLEDALELLDLVDARIAPSPPRALLLRALVIQEREGAAAARKLLREGLERWPGDPMLSWNLAALMGRDEEAERDQLLDEVARGPSLSAAPLARAHLIALELEELMDEDGRLTAGRTEAKRLVDEIEEFARACPHPFARSSALLTRVHLINNLTPSAGPVLQAANEAYEAAPRNPAAIVLLGEFCAALTDSPQEELAASSQRKLQELLPALRRLAQGKAVGPWPASRDQRQIAAELVAAITDRRSGSSK